MSTVADYAGRTYDVLALRDHGTTGMNLVDPSLFGGLDPGGDVGTGVVKLAQWFLLTLLTPKGSKPFDPMDGSSLPAKIGTGAIRTETDAFIAFGFAAGDVMARARSLQTSATPRDEQLASAVLTRATVAPGLLTLSITITTQAGATWTLIAPLPTAP